MNDPDEPPPLQYDINFEFKPNGYEIWFSNRIAEDHQCLVEECADWLEDEVGVVNLGQIEHKALLADGVLTEKLKEDIVAWWALRLKDLEQG